MSVAKIIKIVEYVVQFWTVWMFVGCWVAERALKKIRYCNESPQGIFKTAIIWGPFAYHLLISRCKKEEDKRHREICELAELGRS